MHELEGGKSGYRASYLHKGGHWENNTCSLVSQQNPSICWDEVWCTDGTSCPRWAHRAPTKADTGRTPAGKPCRWHTPNHFKHVANLRLRLAGGVLRLQVCQAVLSGGGNNSLEPRKFSSKGWWICSQLIRANTTGLMWLMVNAAGLLQISLSCECWGTAKLMFHNASTCQGTVVDLFTSELMIIRRIRTKNIQQV